VALLPQPNNTSEPLNQHLEDFSLSDAKSVKTQDSALNLVLQDAARAEKHIMARLWMSEWRVAKAIYEAPVKQNYWRDTLVPRASNSYPLCAQHIRAILDQAMPALFPDNPPFEIEPSEGVPRQVARGWESIIGYQLREANFKAQVRLMTKDAEIFGTGLGKFGWESYEEPATMYRRVAQPKKIDSVVPGGQPTYIHTKESDELEEIPIMRTVSRPFFKRVEINHLLVSPGLREPDVRGAQYVIYRDYPTIRDLNKLRDFEGYDIPSEAELKKLAAPPAETAPSSPMETEGTTFPTQGHRALPRYIDESEDPLEHKLELLEYWTKNFVIVVLQRKVVIRNEGNPLGVIPFVSCYWDDVPGSFYAFGIPRRIGGIQTHIQGLRNLRLDDIHMNLMNMWKTKKGSNIASQPIKQYPGAVFKIDDMDNLAPIEKQPVLQEAYKEEEVLTADAEKTSGANPLMTQGSTSAPGVGTGTRTATGAGAVSAASSSRVQSFVNIIIDQVMLPVVYSFLKMNRLWLDPAVMRKIVGKSIWQSMEQQHDGDLLIDMCNNADIQFNPLAGSDIAAKQRMAQTLPIYSQLLEAPAVQSGLASANLKMNWVEYARRVDEVTGWKGQDDMFIPLTQQDKQERMAQNPKMIDMKSTQARLQQMHENKSAESAQDHGQKLEQIDAQGMANTGEEVLTRSLERGMVQEEQPQIKAGFESLGS